MSEIKNNKPVDAAAAIKLPSQEDLDREQSLIRIQSEKLKLQREMLELEKLTADVETIRNKRATREMASQTTQDSLKNLNEERVRHETNCSHMKGGSAEDLLNGAISRGQDNTNYAMIDHTLTTGVRFRMCQRCGKTWFPKDPDYKWAITRPTKNSPSTGCPSPGLIRNRGPVETGGVRYTSEMPHPASRPAEEKPAGWSPEDML
jgi:hypothetical protein